jgi:hypothetical protein
LKGNRRGDPCCGIYIIIIKRRNKVQDIYTLKNRTRGTRAQRRKPTKIKGKGSLNNPVFCPNSFYELEGEPHPGSLVSNPKSWG